MYKDLGVRRPLKGYPKKKILDFDYFVNEVVCKSDDQNCNVHLRSISSYILRNNSILVDRILTINDLPHFLLTYSCLFQEVNKSSDKEIFLTSAHKEKIIKRYSKDFDLLSDLQII